VATAHPGSKHCFSGSAKLAPKTEKEMTMTGMDNNLRSHRILTVFFALVFGISAVSTAVLPGVLLI
jgi:hypothetical protein